MMPYKQKIHLGDKYSQAMSSKQKIHLGDECSQAMSSKQKNSSGKKPSTSEMPSERKNFEGTLQEKKDMAARILQKVFHLKFRISDGLNAYMPARTFVCQEICEGSKDHARMLSHPFFPRLTGLGAGGKYTKNSMDKLELNMAGWLAEEGMYGCSGSNLEEAKCSTPRAVPVGPHHYGKNHPVKMSGRLDLENSSEETSEYREESEEELRSNLQRRLDNLPVPRQYVIRQLPRSSSEEAKHLMPRAVSIGPYHHGRSHLAEMDSHKHRFVEDFLLRNPGKSLEHYRDELIMIEPHLRKYYSLNLNLNSPGFVDMMLHDGCFILEFLIKFYFQDSDEILENDSLLHYIKTDLLMFENQIPFMVLQTLHGLENTDSLPCIYSLLVNYFWDLSSGLPTLRNSGCHNLLHFYHLQFIPPYVSENWIGKNSKEHHRVNSLHHGFHLLNSLHHGFHLLGKWIVGKFCLMKFDRLSEKFVSQIPSAVQLVKSGVIFRGKRTMNFLDITFQDGVLEIPTISIDESFLLFFVNLAMFEKHNVAVGKVVQTYCSFMHCLLNSSYDLELLFRKGIIESSVISGQELHDLFGRFQNADYMNSEKHFYADLFVDLWEFYEKVQKTKAVMLLSCKIYIILTLSFWFIVYLDYA